MKKKTNSLRRESLSKDKCPRRGYHKVIFKLEVILVAATRTLVARNNKGHLIIHSWMPCAAHCWLFLVLLNSFLCLTILDSHGAQSKDPYSRFGNFCLNPLKIGALSSFFSFCSKCLCGTTTSRWDKWISSSQMLFNLVQ